MDTETYTEAEGFSKLIEGFLKTLLYDGLGDLTKASTDAFIERFVAEEAGKCSAEAFSEKFSTIERSLTLFLEHVDAQGATDTGAASRSGRRPFTYAMHR